MSPDAISKKLKQFDELPDDAVILDAVAAAVLDISTRTLRRHNPVRRIKLSAGCNGRRCR